MFKNILIQAPVDFQHPALNLNLRRVKWWQSPTSPVRYATRVIVWTATVLCALFAVYFVLAYWIHVRSHATKPSMEFWDLLDSMWDVLYLSTAISVGLSYLLDFLIMAFTVGSINGERTAHRWDLLQLTLLSPQSIVQSLYYSNQMRVWRMTMVVVGTRLAVLLLFWCMMFFISPVLDEYNVIDDIIDAIFYNPLSATAVVWFSVLIAGLFLVEPIWRVRSTTALALAVSAHVNRLVVAMSMAFPLLIGVWIGLITLLFGMGWVLVMLANLVDSAGYNFSVAIAVAIPHLGILLGYGYFRLIRRLSLRWALRRSAEIRERWKEPPKPRAALRFSWRRWWLPHSGVLGQNHIFSYNVSRLQWWHGDKSAIRMNTHLVWWTMAVTFFFYMIPVTAMISTFAIEGFGYGPYQNHYGLYVSGAAKFISHLDYIYYALAGIAFALLVLVDIVAVMGSVNAVHRSQIPAHHDLIRLSMTPSEQILQAYRALARTRVWQLTTVVASFHLIGILLACLFYPLQAFANSKPLFSIVGWTLTDPLLLGGLFVLVIYLIPHSIYWRVRGITTMTVMIALRFRRYAMVLWFAITLLMVIIGLDGLIVWIWWYDGYYDEELLFAAYVVSFCGGLFMNWFGQELSRHILRHQLAEGIFHEA